ncbi:MAG: NUDIX hydrolase [Candidatus Nanoarchaeia archaeon]
MPLGTVAAIIEKNKKFLLIQRNNVPFKECWVFPGGHIEHFQSAEEAIIREVKEETHLTFKPKFFRAFDEIFPQLKWHALVMVFSGTFTGTMKLKEDEVKDAKWFSKEEIKKMKLGFDHNNIFLEFLKC